MFTVQTFSPVGSQATAAPSIFTYSTADTLVQVLGAGYFVGVSFNEGDRVQVNCADGDRVVSYSSGAFINDSALAERIIVTDSSQFADIDSTKEYFIDGIIDMTGVSIEVPAAGLQLRGHSFNISKLICADNNYTMFTSPIGGSGDLLGVDYAIEVTGTSSKVYDITSDTGSNAFEFERINYNDCTSLGTITAYRQGLEVGTGRFGGTPSLTLAGTWVGGYRITTSIVRSLDNAMSEPLFKAGAGFTMASRFLTDMNADLGTTAPLLDFSAANFTNPSTLQLSGCTITRVGVLDSSDTTIIPNILPSALASDFSSNQGIGNTFEGGTVTVTAEASTTMTLADTFYDVAGTFTASDLQHFDSPSTGQLRHIGNNPVDYRAYLDLSVKSSANDVLTIRFLKWDNSASSFIEEGRQVRQVNSLVGIRNVAFFTATFGVTLDQNDYLKLQVSSDDTNAVTIEDNSFYTIATR